MVRERAVELAVEDPQVEGQAVEHARHDEPAHAVGRVGHDAQRPQHRRVDEAPDVGRELLEHVERVDAAGELGPLDDSALDRSPGSGAARSPRRSGAAPARHSLMPLYWAGLWLAVNIAAGASRRPDAKYARSVDARPELGDVGAREVTPSANASESGTDDGRMSRDEDPVGAGEAGEGVPDPASDGLVDLVGVDAPDVVGLEDGVQRHPVPFLR